MGKFDELVKIPNQPALRLLAVADEQLSTPLDLPASATVGEVLPVLIEAEAYADAFQLLAAALPIREGVWWACLAARDMLPDAKNLPPALTASEAWVFDPSPKNREAVQAALEASDPSDVTRDCASAVAMHDGTVGPGEYLSAVAAPVGASQMFVLSMCVKAFVDYAGNAPEYFTVLIDRALDIARGGNGRIEWSPEEV